MSDQDQKVVAKRGKKIKRREERGAGQSSSMPESKEHKIISPPSKSSKIEPDEKKDVELSKDLEVSEDTFDQQKAKLEFFTGVDCDVINTLTLIKENDANFSELFEDGLKKIIDDYYGVKTDEPKKNEKRKYSPELFVEEAEGYINQKIPDTVQGCEKLWAAFVSKVALFYEKIRLDLVSHNSVDVLSKFAIEVSVQNEDELKKLKAARKCAFRAHRLFYRSTKKLELLSMINDVKILLKKFDEFDVNKIKEELEKYKVEKKLEEKEKKYKQEEYEKTFVFNSDFIEKFGSMTLHDHNHKDMIFGKKCDFTNTAV